MLLYEEMGNDDTLTNSGGELLERMARYDGFRYSFRVRGNGMMCLVLLVRFEALQLLRSSPRRYY